MEDVWEIDRENGVFIITRKFNNFFYRVLLQESECRRTIFLNVAITSGRKRKDLDNYEEVVGIPSGGIKALVWCFNCIEEFVEMSRSRFYEYKGKDLLVTVKWIDSQRRRVYSRLERYGYSLQRLGDGLQYTKKYVKKS